MARKHRHEEHVNHERWLVSYADFITLLFAFFVVMFASSNADKDKRKQISESVTEALEQSKAKQKIEAMITGGKLPAAGKRESEKPHEAPPGKVAELTPSMTELTAALQAEIKSGKIDLKLLPRGLVISLREAAFFPSGDDRVATASFETLRKVAEVIRKIPNAIRLEGHTDSLPISGRFRSNWELSAARSIAMLSLMEGRFGVDSKRMAIVGYGAAVPVASNETEEGRMKNRRVEITLMSQLALINEPPGISAEAPKGPPAAPKKH